MIHDSSLYVIDERERLVLAPYAMFSAASRGRKHAEAAHPYRGPFQRDRDRILHSSAFRRLSGKMQVFTEDMGDYHRTRLTHTQEVATIARTIARVLRLNEDLVEALALLHDIGHPPYGHAGEDVLNECLRDEGGFSHNQFGLTIVEELEIRYNGFRGLNLTLEVLAGQTARAHKQAAGLHRLLEVQLVDAADSAAYNAHDTDDAVKLRWVELEAMSQVDLIAESLRDVRHRYANLSPDLTRKAVVHSLVEKQVTDLVRESQRALAAHQFGSASEAMSADVVMRPSPSMAARQMELQQFLYQHVYRHPRLIEIRQRAQQRLRRLLEHLASHPEMIPPHFRQRQTPHGLRRAAAEYLAGMTDHFCEQTYRELFGRDG